LKVRVRLAPSPTGNLHIGTARTALFNWLFARKNKGSFLLRIEDTDKERSKSEFTENIVNGLKWLGLNWDEEPTIQSSRSKEHHQAIRLLISKGLAYRCYANEKELELMREKQKTKREAPRYDNRHRNLTSAEEQEYIKQGRDSVIRFRINDGELINWDDLVRGEMNWKGKDLGGDMVIARRAPANKIGDPLYNLVVVIDDGEMGITHVIRGEDHIANTAKQILLYKALKLNIPKFAHTPLILNKQGQKLSKRDSVTSISEFKKLGYTAEAMTNYMTLLGWSPPDGLEERFTLDESSKVFNFDRVNKASAKFDWDKLQWLNSQVLHSWSLEHLLDVIKPIWINEGWLIPEEEWCLDLIKLIQPSLSLLTDAVDQSRFFFEEPIIDNDGIKQLENQDSGRALNLLLQGIKDSNWDGSNIEHAQEQINNISKSSNLKKGLIMKSLRVALMGSTKGPDLLVSFSLLTRVGKAISRIEKTLQKTSS